MYALRNGKIREDPPPNAKKRRRKPNQEEVESTTTEDTIASAENNPSQIKVLPGLETALSTTPEEPLGNHKVTKPT